MKRFIFYSCLLALLITICGCADNANHEIPDGKLQVSQSDTSTNDATTYCSASIGVLVEEINAQGEPLYIPLGADPLVYDGSAINVAVSFNGDSHNPLQAKFFVLVDGILHQTTLEDGTTGYFHQFSFSAYNNDTEEFIVPISFTPIFTEIKDSYDIEFCIYLYYADRLSDPNILETPIYTLCFDVNFVSKNQKLTVIDKSFISVEDKISATDTVYVEYPELSDRTSQYVFISLSEDPTDDKDLMRRVSESDIMNLYLNNDDGRKYQTMIFVDGKYYEAFCNAGYYRWCTETDTVAWAQISATDLGKGKHTIDVLSYCTEESGDSYARFVVSVE